MSVTNLQYARQQQVLELQDVISDLEEKKKLLEYQNDDVCSRFEESRKYYQQLTYAQHMYVFTEFGEKAIEIEEDTYSKLFARKKELEPKLDRIKKRLSQAGKDKEELLALIEIEKPPPPPAPAALILVTTNGSKPSPGKKK